VLPQVQPRTLRHRLERLDTHIRFEFELTAQRLNYLAISESFLFSAYVLSLAYYKAHGIHPTIQTVVKWIPIVGAVLAVVILLSVFAAISMIRKLKREREALDPSAFGLHIHKSTGPCSWEHWFGLLPPVLLPVAFVLAWWFVRPK
jgi:hypothetical protein